MDNPEDNESVEMLQQIINITSEGKTKNLEFMAGKERKKKNYPKANFYYRQILKINPNLHKIQKLLYTSVVEYSNHFLSIARNNIKQGQAFSAIINFNQALKINPHNNQAMMELQAIRFSLQGKLQALKQIGIQQYNDRNYSGAITYFNNYLLVKPMDKMIGEYLRLSTKKKAAIKKLRELQK